ncbi:MAG: LamG domain-containing protein [Candidatus Hodarchaeales archaeon]
MILKRKREILVLVLSINLLIISQKIQVVTAESVEPPSGLVSWWPGDGNTLDINNGNDGILKNGATFAPGIVDQAFCFDGVDDYIWAPSTGIDELHTLTIEFWVKLNSLGPWSQRFVTLKGEKAVLQHDGITDGDVDQLHFFMNFGGPPWEYEEDLYEIRVNYVLYEGDWQHVAGTYDGSVMRLYHDGMPIGSQEVTGTTFSLNWLEFSSEGAPIDGFLDEVAIYNRALSAEEINAIYEAGSSGKAGKVWREPVAQSKKYIQNLPNDAFKDNAEERKNILSNKFDNVFAKIDAGLYRAARYKLQYDIRQKCDGEDGDPKTIVWITDPTAQEDLSLLIDELIAFCDSPKPFG